MKSLSTVFLIGCFAHSAPDLEQLPAEIPDMPQVEAPELPQVPEGPPSEIEPEFPAEPELLPEVPAEPELLPEIPAEPELLPEIPAEPEAPGEIEPEAPIEPGMTESEIKERLQAQKEKLAMMSEWDKMIAVNRFMQKFVQKLIDRVESGEEKLTISEVKSLIAEKSQQLIARIQEVE